MFSRQINDKTKIYLSIPQYAEDLFALTDRNRVLFRQWIPWLDDTKSRAIPKRLGFMNEGTIRRAEKVYENWYDHIVYGKLVTA
jgi:ribosomal-protein-serine acetyltransferase